MLGCGDSLPLAGRRCGLDLAQQVWEKVGVALEKGPAGHAVALRQVGPAPLDPKDPGHQRREQQGG